jgi:hypothetical protein
LLHNDLIIVRNHEDDEKDEWDIMRVMDRQGDVDIKVKIQSNSEFQSLTSSPTQSLGPPRLQINVQDAYEIRFGCSTYAQKEGEKKSFQWHHSQVQQKSDSTKIVETISISRVQLVYELSTLKLMPRSHTTSNWGVPRLLGKVRRYPF